MVQMMGVMNGLEPKNHEKRWGVVGLKRHITVLNTY